MMENEAKGSRIWVALTTIGCTLIMSVTALFLIADWSANSPAVPQQKLEKLHKGMTKDQVRALLGDPRRRTATEAGGEAWMYSHRWKWYSLVVRFSPKNEVIEYVHDD